MYVVEPIVLVVVEKRTQTRHRGCYEHCVWWCACGRRIRVLLVKEEEEDNFYVRRRT